MINETMPTLIDMRTHNQVERDRVLAEAKRAAEKHDLGATSRMIQQAGRFAAVAGEDVVALLRICFESDKTSGQVRRAA